MLKLSIDAARRGFSPKASPWGIPELVLLVRGVQLILTKLPGLRKISKKTLKRWKGRSRSKDELRKLCVKHGIHPQPVRRGRVVCLKKHQLYMSLMNAGVTL